MPLVGTETTSGVIGSGSGSATNAASIDTKVSVRSDRWTCSTPAEYVGGVLGRPSRPGLLLGGRVGYAVLVLAPPSGSATMVDCPTSSISPDCVPTTPRAGNLRAVTSTRDSKEPTALL